MCVYHTKAIRCKGCQEEEEIEIIEEPCVTVDNDPEEKMVFGGCGQTTNKTTILRETLCGPCIVESNAILKAEDKRAKDKDVQNSMGELDRRGR